MLIVIIIITKAIFIFSEELVTNHEKISDEESCTLLSLKKVYLTGLLILQKVAGLSDRATILVIHFFSAFLTLFATLFRIPILTTFAKSIPQTHVTIRRFLGLESAMFVQCAAFPKCHSLYDVSDVAQGRISKCTYVRWPRHTQRSKRKACRTNLCKGMSSTPKLIYSYRPVSSYLRDFVTKESFVNSCNTWRSRSVRDSHLADIYDGSMWKSEVNNYLEGRHNFYGMINVDWFQPFKHTPDSVGK